MGYLDSIRNESGAILALLFVITVLIIAVAPSGMLTFQVTAPATAGQEVSTLGKIIDKPYTLSVTKSGNGDGNVKSAPRGINCGTDCDEKYASGTRALLVAYPSRNSRFAGWKGACNNAKMVCVVRMDGDKKVDAKFVLRSNRTRDTTAPIITSQAHEPQNPQQGGTVKITISAEDNKALATIGVRVYGTITNAAESTLVSGAITAAGATKSCTTSGKFNSCTFEYSGLSAGSYSYLGFAFDAAGNAGQGAANVPFTVSAVSSGLPTLSARLLNTNPTIYETVSVSIKGVDDTGFKSIGLNIDGVESVVGCSDSFSETNGVDSIGGPTADLIYYPKEVSCLVPLTYYAPGKHTFFATATDISGNSVRYPADGTISFEVYEQSADDESGLTAIITHSPTNPTVDQNITITAKATDDKEIRELAIFVDSVRAKTCGYGLSPTASTCELVVRYSTTGKHNYHAYVVDTEGNELRDPSDGGLKSFNLFNSFTITETQ